MIIKKENTFYIFSFLIVFIIFFITIMQINFFQANANENEKPTSIILKYSAKNMRTLPAYRATMSYPITIDYTKPDINGKYPANMDSSRTEDLSKMCDECDPGEVKQTSKFVGIYEESTGELEGDLIHTYTVSTEPKRKSDSEYQYGGNTKYNVSAKINITAGDDSNILKGKVYGGTSKLRTEYFGDSGDGYIPKPIEESFNVDWDVTATLSFEPIQNPPVSNSEGSDRKVGLVRGTAQLSRTKEKGVLDILKGDSWLDLDKDEVIIVKTYDKIRTGANSRLILKYPDGSIFKMKSNSTVTILPNGIKVEVGDTWFNLKKQGSKFEVVVPHTVCGVLGTEFSVFVAENGDSIIQLAEGELSIEVEDPSVLINAGQKVLVTKSDYLKETFDAKALKQKENNESNEDLSNINWDNAKSIDIDGDISIILLLLVIIIILTGLFIILKKNRIKN